MPPANELYDYEIIVEGQLSEQWLDWFYYISLQIEENQTRIFLSKVDLAAFYGVLIQLRNKNHVIIALKKLPGTA
ncbi:MAG: hypothetical protein CVU39_11555 [Chloroflexi bacterium HGW-Chloroflexi-10]|nr:MAG: hypothetical protein CVU39_11555 [Chloroflexi bacterium HGW-Chloroflexi-10]